jgi:serine/threonine protein kinase
MTQAFIAMEFLDGVTLKHRIAGRPLETETIFSPSPSRSPMRSTRRTPKESSIATSSLPTSFVTKRGHAKILDFGLAKVAPTANSSSQIASENRTNH